MDAWTEANVEQWLNARGFPQFVDTFKENDVNGLVLTELNEEALQELEVPEDLHADFILKRDTDLNLAADQIVAAPSRRKKKKRRQFKQEDGTGEDQATQEKPKEEDQHAERGQLPADTGEASSSNAAATEQPLDEADTEAAAHASAPMQDTNTEARLDDKPMARPSRRRQRFKAGDSGKSQESETEAGDKPSQQEAREKTQKQQKPAQDVGDDTGKESAETPTKPNAPAHPNKQGKTPPARPAPPPTRPPPPSASARARAATAASPNNKAGSHAGKSGSKGITRSGTTASASKRGGGGAAPPARPAAPTSASPASAAKHKDASSPQAASSATSASSAPAQQRKTGSRPEITVVGAKPITGDFKKMAHGASAPAQEGAASAAAPLQKKPSSGGRPEITIVSARPMDKSSFHKPLTGSNSSDDDGDESAHDQAEGIADHDSGAGDAAHKAPQPPTRIPLSDSRRLEILQRVKNGEISQEEAAEIIEKEERELAEREGGPPLQAEEKQSALTRLRKLGKASATGLSKFAQRVGRATQKTYQETFGNVDLPSTVVETSVVRDLKKEFGFLISAGGAPPVVNSITYADMCPDVQLGDVVEVINDIDCHFMSGLKARELLNQTPHGFKANIRLRRRGPDDDPAVQRKKQPHQTEAQRPQPAPRGGSSEKVAAGQSPGTKSSSSSSQTASPPGASKPATREGGPNGTPQPKPRPQPKPAPAKPAAQHQQEKPKAPPRRRSSTSSGDKKPRPVPAPRKPSSDSTSA